MKVGVLGLGNVLRRDDGFGPSVVRRLEGLHAVPPDVVVRDLGTPGLDLPSHLVGLDAVVVVDAIEGAGPPGTLRTWPRDEWPEAGPPAARLTNHGGDLRDALAVADLHGGGPREVWLLGVVVGDLGDGPGLSDPVDAAVDPAVEAVVRLLRAWGVTLARPPAPAPSDPWWRVAGRVRT